MSTSGSMLQSKFAAPELDEPASQRGGEISNTTSEADWIRRRSSGSAGYSDILGLAFSGIDLARLGFKLEGLAFSPRLSTPAKNTSPCALSSPLALPGVITFWHVQGSVRDLKQRLSRLCGFATTTNSSPRSDGRGSWLRRAADGSPACSLCARPAAAQSAAVVGRGNSSSRVCNVCNERFKLQARNREHGAAGEHQAHEWMPAEVWQGCR
ncbi:hypothetical protein PHYPSEUDO_012466 [Phytophthora pseudosyringae]|uniref:Uncharacterized protein n=1 Tax=Phytophthora pseudosyringae TaxID=221518 RepID=A0A8T1WMG3_9STRA|nr:hypothetical protein PHYPSEUDO_012466 [Phytophthora pseudosyringae]